MIISNVFIVNIRKAIVMFNSKVGIPSFPWVPPLALGFDVKVKGFPQLLGSSPGANIKKILYIHLPQGASAEILFRRASGIVAP